MKTLTVISIIISIGLLCQLRAQEIEELKKFKFQTWDQLKSEGHFTESRKQEIVKELRSSIEALKSSKQSWEKDFSVSVNSLTLAVEQTELNRIGMPTTEWSPLVAIGMEYYSKHVLEIRSNGKENQSEEKILSLVTKMEHKEFYDVLVPIKDNFKGEYSFIPSKHSLWQAPRYGPKERYLFAIVASDPVGAWKLFYVDGTEVEKELYFYAAMKYVNALGGTLSQEKILDTAGRFIEHCLRTGLKSNNENLIKDTILTANVILENSFRREGLNWADNKMFQSYIKEVNESANKYRLDENTEFRISRLRKLDLLQPNINFIPRKD